MKTENTKVTGTVYIWAIPKSEYAEESADPFYYELSSDSYKWNEGAVRVCEEEVTLCVPSDINLVARAIETLEEKKEELNSEMLRNFRRIDERIQSLLRLEYTPTVADALEEALD